MYVCARTTDMAGNTSYMRSLFPVNISTVQPGVILDYTGANPTNTIVTITITNSEAVSGFTAADLVVNNGTVTSFVHLTGTTYQAVITPAADGVVEVIINS